MKILFIFSSGLAFQVCLNNAYIKEWASDAQDCLTDSYEVNSLKIFNSLVDFLEMNCSEHAQ